MRRKLLTLAFALAAVLGAEAGLFTLASNAASGCWQVDCNTCCRLSGGGTVCTQRACL
jgi:hypothetical protein